MGYSKNVITGVTWQTVLRVITALVSLGKIAFLARLLSPTDFGLFSLVAIALGLSEASTQTGVNVTILQSRHSIKYFLDTAWVIAIIRGFIIGSVMIALGIAMGHYYQEPSLQFLVALTALVPIVKGFINPSIVLYQKNLEFLKDATFRFAVTLVEATLALTLGWWLQSVTALILALVGAALAEVALSFIVFKLKPKFHYLQSRGAIIFKNARSLTLSSIFNYINENIDDVIIGKVLGTQLLGFYHNGYGLSHKPNAEIGKVIHNGTMPVFARIAHDRDRLRKAFYRSLVTSLTGVTVLSLPLFLFPSLLTNIVLGPDWNQVAPILPWLGVAGIIQCCATITYGLLLATAHYKALNSHLGLTTVLLIPLVFFFSSWNGLQGAVFGLALARITTLPVLLIGIRQALATNYAK